MVKIFRNLLPILAFSLIPTLLIWAPFFFKASHFWTIPLPQDGMATIVANYDGPLYLAIAKTSYNREDLMQNYSFDLPIEYYAAHFPLFSYLLKPFATVLGFPYSMLFVTLLSSFAALFYFNKLARKYLNKKDALFLTFVFSVFPARWLIVRSVGSAEPLFIAAIIASIYYFGNKNYWLAGLFGAVAQLTKSPGILLFIAYFIAIIVPDFNRMANLHSKKWLEKIELYKAYPLLLIPASLLGIFFYYRYTFNDFFAYFNSGDNIHLFFPPFQVFNYSEPWVGTFWLEEIIFIYLLAIIGFIKLMQQKRHELAAFVGVFFVSIFFVAHRDIMRYALPVIPFILIAYSNVLVKKEFKIALAFILIPIYLFSIAFISQNTMPISDWGPFL